MYMSVAGDGKRRGGEVAVVFDVVCSVRIVSRRGAGGLSMGIASALCRRKRPSRERVKYVRVSVTGTEERRGDSE